MTKACVLRSVSEEELGFGSAALPCGFVDQEYSGHVWKNSQRTKKNKIHKELNVFHSQLQMQIIFDELLVMFVNVNYKLSP